MNVHIKNVHISLLALFFLRGLEYAMIVPLLPFYYTLLTETNMTALHYFSVHCAIYGFIGLVMSLILGPIYDKTRNAKVILVPSILIFITGLCIYVVSWNRYLSLISAAFTGSFSALHVIGNAEISRLGKQATCATTLLNACDSVGLVLATSFNLALPSVLFRYGFISFNAATIPGIVTILVAFIVFLILIFTIDGPVTHDKFVNESTNTFKWRDIPNALYDKERLVLYVTGFFTVFSFTSFNIFLQSNLMLCMKKETVKAQCLTLLMTFLTRFFVLLFVPRLSKFFSERILILFTNCVQIFFLVSSPMAILTSSNIQCAARIATGVYSFTLIWISGNVLVVSSLGQLLDDNYKASGQGFMVVLANICNFFCPALAGAFLNYQDSFSVILAGIVLVVTIAHVVLSLFQWKTNVISEENKELFKKYKDYVNRRKVN